MKYSLMIGRWQPLHKGHIALIKKVLSEGKKVCIAIRATEEDENNPHTVSERQDMIRKHFDEEDVIITVIPDIAEVVYGREVGYGIRELRIDSDTEAISGTKIRNGEIEIDEMD